MADQADPLELDNSETAIESRARKSGVDVQELRNIIGAYTQVKDLVLHPGWPVLIDALEKRSDFWKNLSSDLLSSILLKNDGTNNSAFTDARVHHLATEEAITILLVMRKEAQDSQKFLDEGSEEVRDSSQKG